MFSKYYFVTQHSNVKEFKKIIIQKTWLIDLLCTVYITNPVNIYKHANMLVNVMSTSDLFQIDFKIITSIIRYDFYQSYEEEKFPNEEDFIHVIRLKCANQSSNER